MRSAALVLLGSSLLSSVARAAVVEAGSLTTVTVDAPLYDTRLSAAGGCNPAGCSGDLTRDGDSADLKSRWSCKPNLDTGKNAACSITYGLATPQTIESLEIAMYQGDTRMRTVEIYVDGTKIKSWTSSGTTTAFENVQLGVDGQIIELRGVLGSSEWLSIAEVEILVDDGAGGGGADTMEVEAGTLGTVTAIAELFDTRLASANGCDPEGCTAALTRDGDVSQASRWACATSLGGQCRISYNLGAPRDLTELRLAMYKGASRVRTVEVYVDDVFATTWTSSGTTADFESIDLTGYSGQTVAIVGVQARSEWLSIVETQIMVLSEGMPPSPTPPAPTPGPSVPSPEPPSSSKEIGEIGTVTTTAELFDSNLSANNGCDPSGCTAALTRDGNVEEGSRWSCAPKLGGQGAACTISYDLDTEYSLDALRIALYKGASRVRTVDVHVDGVLVTTWTSSGTTNGFESIDLTGTVGQVIEITGVLTSSEWISIVETEIMVFPEGGVTTPPSPAPAGDLQTVGLLPLAIGNYPILDKAALKDGDLSTSWTCSGGPNEPSKSGRIFYDCSLTFGLVYFRNIKQVKIALADGDGRAVDMRISARYHDKVVEKFVTSSGMTTALETYDFDYTTTAVTIEPMFSEQGQTFTISEVEFVEETADGEVLLSDFNFPFRFNDDRRNEPTGLGFEWSSDSPEALNQRLGFTFAGYFEVTEMLLRFPVDDTYKFELEIFSDLDGTGEAYTTIADLESDKNVAGWQSFDLTGHADRVTTTIHLIVKGTGSGAPGFKLLDAKILGTQVDNPSDTFYVGSTLIDYWSGDAYPEFVAVGTGDQKAINGAICAVKKASYDGDQCVGGDDTATGTVKLSFGAWYVDGSIVLRSGVLLEGWYSIDDSPHTTDIKLEESAAGNPDVKAIISIDNISDASLKDLWLNGLYDPEASNGDPEAGGFGTAGIYIRNSGNITLKDIDVRYCDGSAVVIRNSRLVNIDAGPYDEEYLPWRLGQSRLQGLSVDQSDDVWVRRHTFFDNGVAGIHLLGCNNFTFEATIDPSGGREGEGNVGSLDGQQPIEVLVQSSTLVKFQDMRVQSVNDPVMSVFDESSAVSFTNCGFSNVQSGTCVIKMDDPSAVTIDADEDELSLVGDCYVKV